MIGHRVDWKAVAAIYRAEMTSAFRDKHTVANSIIVPIVLYPLILWVAFTGMSYVKGQSGRVVFKVAVPSWPEGTSMLERQIRNDRRIEVVGDSAARERIGSGGVDALLELMPGESTQGAPRGNVGAKLTYDGATERGRAARDHLSALLDKYRARWLEHAASGAGVSKPDWQVYTISMRNASSKRQMGRFILGLILPIFFAVMIAVGTFYPAIDTTAGERERGTWETSLTFGIPLSHVVFGKYLAVVTFGMMGGVLNIAAMLLTIRPILAPLLAGSGEKLDFTLEPAAVPFILVGAILLAGFIAAGMMLFAAFARTFKEGQSMITPFYLLVIIPLMFLTSPDLVYSPAVALIPVVNVALMTKEAISGSVPLLPAIVTCASSLAVIAAAVSLAARILTFEDFLIGSYAGSMGKFVKERLLGRRKAV